MMMSKFSKAAIVTAIALAGPLLAASPAFAAAPETTLDSAPVDPTNSTTATFTFHSSQAGGTFRCSIETEPYVPCSSPATYSGLVNGLHSFRVEAINAAGEIDTSASGFAWSIDATDPTAVIESAKDGAGAAVANGGTTSNADITFTFSTNEPGSPFTCNLDAATPTPCVSPKAYTGLAAGTHTLQFTVTDALHNSSTSTWTWTVATAAAGKIYNGDMSIVGSNDVLAGIDANGRPDGWFPGGHGDNTRNYVYGTWAQQSGPAKKFAKVKVSRFVNGNASWISQDIPVSGGQTYVLTHDYRSDVPSTLGLRFKTGGVNSYMWLNSFPATDTFLQVPVRRRFTVPAGASQMAIYSAISSVGYLEIGGFALLDPAVVDAPKRSNMIKNGNLLEVDKNNEPVGWHHISTTGDVKAYKWQACSMEKGKPPTVGVPGPCGVERGNYISLGSPEGGDFLVQNANWYTDEIPLPAAKSTAPRNLEIGFILASAGEPYTRIRYTMADGTKVIKTVAITQTDGDFFWAGGSDETPAEVPAGAVSFSLFLTRWAQQGSSISKFADISVKFVDPGVHIGQIIFPDPSRLPFASVRPISHDGLYRYPIGNE
jgi:hypothetical protein